MQYWQENANDDGYSYVNSEVRNALVGSQVSGSDDKNYVGFHYDHADQDVLINGDGTSVVNVYYKRNTYTLTFKVDEGFVFSNWVTKKEFQNVKFGKDTSIEWSQAPSGYLWYTTKDGDTFYTAAPDMPNNDLVVYGKNSNGSSTVHYYEDGTTIKIKPDLNVQSSGWSFTEEDYIKIPGFTYERNSITGTDYNLYYTRNKYKLDFNNRGDIVSKEIPYDDPLTSHFFEPNYPTGLEPGGYFFDGWYTDPGCTNAVNWETAKMPYQNTLLYAKWSPMFHKVTTWLTSEMKIPVQVGDTHIQSIPHRSLAAKPTTPTYGNYTFVGWYDNCGSNKRQRTRGCHQDL